MVQTISAVLIVNFVIAFLLSGFLSNQFLKTFALGILAFKYVHLTLFLLFTLTVFIYDDSGFGDLYETDLIKELLYTLSLDDTLLGVLSRNFLVLFLYGGMRFNLLRSEFYTIFDGIFFFFYRLKLYFTNLRALLATVVTGPTLLIEPALDILVLLTLIEVIPTQFDSSSSELLQWVIGLVPLGLAIYSSCAYQYVHWYSNLFIYFEPASFISDFLTFAYLVYPSAAMFAIKFL